MKKALITGVSGQDGGYLAQILTDRGFEVYGAVRRGSTSKTERLKYLGIKHKVKYVTLEMTEYANIQSVLDEVRPDYIFNLAAQTFIVDSFDYPQYTSSVNYNGLKHLLDSVKLLKLDCKIFQASTSDMFGKANGALLNETSPYMPVSPYAVSKQAAHILASNYREQYGMFISCGILFNHESEMRGYEFVTRKITSWLADIKLFGREAVPLGNMSNKRDWGYAPEYMDAAIRIMDHDTPDDFIISTGTEYSVREFLLFAAAEIGLELTADGEGANEKFYDKRTGRLVAYSDPAHYREHDIAAARGDNSKLKETLDWEPRVLAPEIARRMAVFDLKMSTLAHREANLKPLLSDIA